MKVKFMLINLKRVLRFQNNNFNKIYKRDRVLLQIFLKVFKQILRFMLSLQLMNSLNNYLHKIKKINR